VDFTVEEQELIRTGAAVPVEFSSAEQYYVTDELARCFTNMTQTRINQIKAGIHRDHIFCDK